MFESKTDLFNKAPDFRKLCWKSYAIFGFSELIYQKRFTFRLSLNLTHKDSKIGIDHIVNFESFEDYGT